MSTVFAVQAVLFDLDGTLLDSAPDLAGAAEQLRQRRGLPPLPLSAYRNHTGSGARGMLQVAFGIGPEHADFVALRDEFFNAYEACLSQHTRAFDGIPELIGQLQQAGLAWGVVTNKMERFMHPLLAGMPLFDRAGAQVGGDSTPHPKPHPAPLLEAARRLGLAPEACVYVGDDERDIIAGRAAGMYTVAAAYGYVPPHTRADAWGADVIIDSPQGLLKYLKLP